MDGDRAERIAALIDALRKRLGPHRVRRFEPVASHVPERAEILPPLAGGNSDSMAASRNKRARFCCCRAPSRPKSRRSFPTVRRGGFAGAARPMTSPARKAPNASAPNGGATPHARERGSTRDYYLVEDVDGRRFWLYREGLYGA